MRGDGAGVAEAVPDHVAHRRGLGLDLPEHGSG
jgi:hypothetical protein